MIQLMLKELAIRAGKLMLTAFLGALIVMSGCMGSAGGVVVLSHIQPEFGSAVGVLTQPTPGPGSTSGLPGVPVPIVPSTNSWAAAAIATAMTWLNVPYLWGGCTVHGVDCSCFVQNVLKSVGISAPRVTVDQIRWAIPIPRAQAQPGDLVFFDNTCTNCGANPTHVGMLIGDGLMIQAGGVKVSIQPAFTGFYGALNPRVGRPH